MGGPGPPLGLDSEVRMHSEPSATRGSFRRWGTTSRARLTSVPWGLRGQSGSEGVHPEGVSATERGPSSLVAQDRSPWAQQSARVETDL